MHNSSLPKHTTSSLVLALYSLKIPNHQNLGSAMAQDSSNGHQGTDASNDHGSAPPVTDTDTTLSPGEHSNSGSLTGVPVAEDARNGKDVKELGSAGSAHSGTCQSKGKRSAAEVAAATANDTNADNTSKGMGKVAAPDDKGAGGRRRKQLPHSISEHERRKRMKSMFTEMQALLPHVLEKTDKATVVGEAISFIRVLEGTVAKLEKRKQDIVHTCQATVANLEAASAAAVPPNRVQGTAMSSGDLPQGWAWLPKQQHKKPAAAAGFQTWSGTNVVLSMFNDDAFISVCTPRHAGVLLLVLSVLEKNHLNVITVQVASNDVGSMFSIHTRVNAAAIQKLGIDPPASEDIYKLAVSEIMVWLSN